MNDEDLRRNALDDSIRWASGVLLQIERLEVLQDRLAQDAVAQLRCPPKSSYTQEDRAPFHQLRTERHFLFIAGRQLVGALDRLASAGADLRLPEPIAGDVRVLRDCLEHWDEKDGAEERTDFRGRAYRQFAERRPGDDPGEHRFGGGSTHVGGIGINDLRDSVRPLIAHLLELEQSSFVWRGWEFR